jgi:hypothetical protein
MINQPVSEVLCEKALGNEHFAKVPVKRDLRSSGCTLKYRTNKKIGIYNQKCMLLKSHAKKQAKKVTWAVPSKTDVYTLALFFSMVSSPSHSPTFSFLSSETYLTSIHIVR